jgi:hypothetical protein
MIEGHFDTVLVPFQQAIGGSVGGYLWEGVVVNAFPFTKLLVTPLCSVGNTVNVELR